ncbi:MAG TPA: hypothetical protein VKH44_04415, partial [Pirellulaceae bacterium]|nr:hypothetical protein [Pirellulaceae bacterium]
LDQISRFLAAAVAGVTVYLTIGAILVPIVFPAGGSVLGSFLRCGPNLHLDGNALDESPFLSSIRLGRRMAFLRCR